MSIVVVGDTLLDVDLSGSAERLSPDAPVPVIDVARSVMRAGGAGLVARMLADDGEDVLLVTVLSDDGRSGDLRDALYGITVVAGASNGPTPVKTRLRAAQQAIARIDEGCVDPATPTVTEAMIAAIEAADAVLVADYGRGVAADERIRAAIAARAGSVPVVWDPHPRGAVPVPGLAAVTPNLAEARAFSGATGTGLPLAVHAGERLREAWDARAVIVTMGASGALLCSLDAPRGPVVVPAPAVAATDPCGAGDRLAATLVRELQGGSAVAAATAVAVRSASGFLAAGGVAGMGAGRWPVQIGGPAGDALTVAAAVRAAGGTVVATGGCFDLLHAGHARTLSAARGLGDCLIVCLNSDASVRRLKGAERPIIAEADRVDLLLALECVDAVLVFEENSPEEALRRLRPDVWVKGGDYSVDDLPEAPLITSWGGCTVTVPYHPARSTSRLASALARVS
ncbi:PfkB family carbohydrate kinase [Cryobacterium tepidiphilum]|uniref:Bifunctional heptose 7-phosphate kinase/heptose 1-phosphate adenyltransferase n=1 Tax=Cryobacterium tepidiphilum TaxID=2486026 RepID=A0A3M8LAQ8_9MICO|nr:PfkB family carbohydrate kinase [Cryobacterium tepidiphilum]RNE62405.1 bifunctional heptose 7-phosphate kinase/heptose 1-phosphate adenyltransferase [Cryobacterium tepidiphilum]